MTSQPPNAMNAVLLVTRLHARRLLNRMRTRLGRGLAGKGIAGAFFALFFGGLMMFNAAFLTSGLVRSLGHPIGFYERVSIGFKKAHQTSDWLFPSLAIWNLPDEAAQLAAKLGEVLLLMACCRLCMGISSANQDLGKVEGSLEWLFTLPVSARALCLAQVLAYAVIDPFGWVVCFPFLLVVFESAGLGGIAIPAAAGISLYLGLVLGCCQSAIETILRKTCSPARLKNLQAVFSLAGFSLFFLLILVARPDTAVIRFLEHSPSPPAAVLWNPFTLPVQFCLPNIPKWLVLTATCAYAALFVLLAVRLFERMVRNGLLATSAVYEGKRGRASDARPAGRALFRGIIGKDLRLLMRDRNFLVQTLVLPLVIVAYQVFNAGLFKGAMTNFAHASTVAFGVGAYTLTSSAFAILAVEGNSLWMLYTFPRPLDSILLEKTLLWTGVALLYTTSVLAYFAWSNHGLPLAAMPEAAMAMAGIVVYSFIASGIGVLATDPLRVEPGRRRFRPAMVYLYLVLAGLYGYALHSGSLWIEVASLVFASLVAWVLWRKVSARVPWMLDAHVTPPQR